MRIPSGSTDRYIYFVAVDATDLKTRETGFSSFTVYRSRNGGAASAMTTPTVNETDSSNMPGVYELLVDEDTTLDSGKDEHEMVLHITHAGMAPVSRAVEIYRPKATEGETVTASSGGVNVSPAGVDAILDEQIGDSTITLRQAAKVLIASLAGKLSGAATTTVSIRNAADTTNVIVATVDADGNRSAVTLSV